jgi:hypothetical protein
MSDKNELTTLNYDVNSNLPAFMTGQEHEGTEQLKQFIVPPRIKAVQKLSRKPFSERFKPGDLVVIPLLERLAEYNGGKAPAFYFVPILFYPEWVAWNPIEVRGTLPSIRERSFDPKSEIAVRSRSPNTRTAICPEIPKKDGKDLYIRYLEHLNFIICIMPPSPFANVPIVMTFASGEYRAGQVFSTLLYMRRAPLYGCQFEAVVRERENAKGSWFGIDVQNPSSKDVSPFVQDEKMFEYYRSLHREYKKFYEQQAIQVDYSDDEFEEVPDSKEF